MTGMARPRPARIGQAVNRTGGARFQMAIAGALLAAGLEAEASALADAADQPNLPADQRRDLASLRTGIAIRATDRLNEDGDQAQAFERLRPVLAADPDNPELRLALARLYQGARQPGGSAAHHRSGAGARSARPRCPAQRGGCGHGRARSGEGGSAGRGGPGARAA